MSGIEAWSTTPSSNNAAAPDGFPEGMTPGSVNNSARQLMASVRTWFEDAQWTNWGHVPTRTSGTTFTVPGDLTAIYHVGRRLKVTGSATGYCTISVTSFGSPNTTVTVVMDTGSLPVTLSAVYLSAIPYTNTNVPQVTVAASETQAGAVELATVAEATTGTDTARAVTAAGVAAKVAD